MSYAVDTVSSLRHNPLLPVAYRIDLAGLQALCAINYARLLQIFPAMSAQTSVCIAVEGLSQPSCTVLLRVCEQSRYTTLLEITSEMNHAWPLSLRGLGLGVQVRVYHDAQMAEVVASLPVSHAAAGRHLLHRHFQPRYEYPNEAMYQPDEKYQMNSLLGEWLACCLTYGCSTDALRCTLPAARGSA